MIVSIQAIVLYQTTKKTHEMAGKSELKGGPAAKRRKTNAKADDVPLVLDKGTHM